MIKEYTTASGSRYRVDLERLRVKKVGADEEWRDCVFVAADGKLTFHEPVIDGDPGVVLVTITSFNVGVRDVVEN